MNASVSNPPISFLQKSLVNFQQKEAICQRAANLIEDGDVVFLDCGSTVFRICNYIRHKQIKVVTNSLPIVNELIQAPSISLNFAGGEIDMERQAAHGKIAVAHFKNYRADKTFVGIDGISAKYGLSARSEKEAEITIALVENAKAAYLLCDSSKLEKDAYLPFAPLQFIPNLITDSLANRDILAAYEAEGIKVIIAS
jgi:DeoR family fructose operon transcriptional repressor